MRPGLPAVRGADRQLPARRGDTAIYLYDNGTILLREGCRAVVSDRVLQRAYRRKEHVQLRHETLHVVVLFQHAHYGVVAGHRADDLAHALAVDRRGCGACEAVPSLYDADIARKGYAGYVVCNVRRCKYSPSPCAEPWPRA